MAGMEQAFFEWNVCAKAGNQGIRIADADSIAYICTGGGTAASFAITLSPTYSGGTGASYIVPSGWAPIVHYYTDSSNGAGTAVWSDKVANNAAGIVYGGTAGGTGSATVPYTGTIGVGVAILFTVLASMVPIGYQYINVTASAGTGLVIAITDPVVQRRSNFMPAMAA
jgi:hypothetical protein